MGALTNACSTGLHMMGQSPCLRPALTKGRLGTLQAIVRDHLSLPWQLATAPHQLLVARSGGADFKGVVGGVGGLKRKASRGARFNGGERACAALRRASSGLRGAAGPGGGWKRVLVVATAAEGGSGDSRGGRRRAEDLKKAVMVAVANTNRGKNLTVARQREVVRLIEELEALNPTPDPARSPLLSGCWSLLYTGPADESKMRESFLAGYAGAEEGPFLSFIKPLAFGAVRQRASTQVIDSAASRVDNIADFTVFSVPGTLSIQGVVEEAPPLPGHGVVRLTVTFLDFTLRLGDWLNVRVPLSRISPKGWVDTTYVDQDMRVGRGDKGSVFVTARQRN